MTQSRFSRSARTMLYAVFALSTVGLPVTASALDLTGHWQSVSLNCRGIDSSGHHTGEMVAFDLDVSQVAGSDEIRVLNRSVEYYGLAFRNATDPSRAAGGMAIRCSQPGVTSVSSIVVKYARTFPDSGGISGRLKIAETAADGSGFVSCGITLIRTSQVDPGVPACP